MNHATSSLVDAEKEANNVPVSMQVDTQHMPTRGLDDNLICITLLRVTVPLHSQIPRNMPTSAAAAASEATEFEDVL